MIWTHALTTYRLQKNVGLCCPRHFLFVPISPKAVLPHFLFFLLSVLTSNAFCLGRFSCKKFGGSWTSQPRAGFANHWTSTAALELGTV